MYKKSKQSLRNYSNFCHNEIPVGESTESHDVRECTNFLKQAGSLSQSFLSLCLARDFLPFPMNLFKIHFA